MTYVVWALAVLAAGALLPLVLARWQRLALTSGVGAMLLGGVLCAGAAVAELRGLSSATQALRWSLPFGAARLALDGLSAWFLLTIGVLALAVAPYSWSYFRTDANRGRSHVPASFLCILTGAMALLVCAADAVLFLLAWELMSLAAFVLVATRHREAGVPRAAWMYLVATHLGTALFLLPLFGFLVAKAGSTDLHAFRSALQSTGSGICVVLFLLGLLGFGTKAGFMPMHVWLPVAHPAAASPVSALLSGVVLKTGIYGLLRLLGWLPNLPTSCAVILLVFGMTSGVLGVLYALAQHDLKRLLAYHSVENIGIIGLGIGMGMLGQSAGQPALIALGYGGALLHVLNHTLFKGLLFLSAGAVIHGTGTGNIERLGGLARKTPVNAALFLIAALSICALPPLNGFVSEWLIYGSLFGGVFQTSRATAGIAVLGTVSLALMGGLALACFAKAFSVVFLGEPRDASIRAHATPVPMRLSMAILAALCISIGVLPGSFVPLTTSGVCAVGQIQPAEFAGSMLRIVAPAGQLSLTALVLVGVTVGLAIARRVLLRKSATQPAAAVGTWGCGYAAPSARMQYTASSFAGLLIQSFRPLLWSHRDAVAPTGAFPGHAQLESHTPDMAEQDVFRPLFRGVARVFQMVRTVSWSGAPAAATESTEPEGRINPLRLLLARVTVGLRRGSIQTYLTFIVLALLVVFLVEAFASPGPRSPTSSGSALEQVQGVAP
jgi:formate hydrogenlyase subunit 3/multisubunit Na+/H+ antiporter MnhD subunit